MNIIEQVAAELEHATRKYPTWPSDPFHALTILGEEFGELSKAVLQVTYEPHKATLLDVQTEAIQTAAMALRFALSLGGYQYAPSAQHEQQPAAGSAAFLDEELLVRLSLANEGVLDLDELVAHFVRLGLDAYKANRDSETEELF